jgi:hypothetical protein
MTRSCEEYEVCPRSLPILCHPTGRELSHMGRPTWCTGQGIDGFIRSAIMVLISNCTLGRERANSTARTQPSLPPGF